MRRIMVIGCNSLELTGDGIQVRWTGVAALIAWRDVTAAALAGKDRQMMQMAEAISAQMGRAGPELESAGVFGELIQKTLELRETHEALLIVHAAGIIHALIEQDGPERDALLAGLRTNLADRWLGEDFTSQELEKRFGRQGSGCSLRAVGCAAVLIGGLLLIMFGWILVTTIPGATIAALLEALFAGDWKSALIAGTVLLVALLVYWVVANSPCQNAVRGGWIAFDRIDWGGEGCGDVLVKTSENGWQSCSKPIKRQECAEPPKRASVSGPPALWACRLRRLIAGSAPD
jgi:hypothetical protein